MSKEELKQLLALLVKAANAGYGWTDLRMVIGQVYLDISKREEHE